MIDPLKLMQMRNPPRPQIGALLNYNSFLPEEQDPFRYMGSRHWDLEGGAILVAPDRVLTLRHTLQKKYPGEQAVFLPGHGIFKVDAQSIVPERASDRADLDWLVLLRLVRPILGLPPLPFQYLSRKSEGMKSIDLYAWGGWRFAKGVHGTVGSGIQRSISLPPEDPGAKGYPRLDVLWTCPLGELVQALRDNSGGAVIGRNEKWEEVVVGVIRSADGEKHSASRIGEDRERWLRKAISAEPIEPSPSAEPLRLSFVHECVTTTKRWIDVALPAPSGSRRAQVTLSATPGLLLQAELDVAPWNHALLAKLARRQRASGRFLYRDLDLSDGAGAPAVVHLGVAVLEEGPELRDEVDVQICATFYD